MPVLMALLAILMLPCGAVEADGYMTAGGAPQGVQEPTEEADYNEGEEGEHTSSGGLQEPPDGTTEEMSQEMAPETVPETGEGDVTFEEIEAWVMDRVVPYIILAASAVFSIYLAILPIIKKVKSASDNFEEATGGVTKANEDNDKTQKANALLLEQMKSERQTLALAQENFERSVLGKLKEFIETVQGELDDTRVQTREIRDMVQVGFCNNADLVKRGVAKQIARIAGGADIPSLDVDMLLMTDDEESAENGAGEEAEEDEAEG